MYNVRFFPSHLPVDLLCNNGWKSAQPPWPSMLAEVYAALPDDVRWLYEHAPLPAPAPTRLTSVQNGEEYTQEVGEFTPEYMGTFPPTEADIAEWRSRFEAATTRSGSST